MTNLARLAPLAAALILVAACDSSTAPPRLEPGLNLNVQGALSDTITAPSSRVVVTLVDDEGDRLAGVTVALSVANPDAVWLSGESGLPTAPPTVTDADGRLTFRMHRTVITDTTVVRIVATSGATTWRDSIEVMTTAGKPVQIAMPIDTALYQGSTIQWRGDLLDRGGNRAVGTPTFSAASPGITVNGSTITAVDGPSRQQVHATFGTLQNDVFLSIVPEGEIVVVVDRGVLEGADADWAYARLSLDGSSYTPLLTRTAFAGRTTALSPYWFPDGEHLAFRLDDGIGRIDLTGAFETIVPSPAANVRLHCPSVTADGSSILAHRITEGNFGAVVWRAGVADGVADTATLSPPHDIFSPSDACPSASPDGRFIAVASDRDPLGGLSSEYFVQVIDTQQGTVNKLPYSGFPAVRWSPDGEWLVSATDNGNVLYVVRPNGMDYKQLGTGYESWASWSPDGEWIVVEREGPSLALIQPSTGLVLPLGFTGYLRHPAWRPTPAAP